MKLFKNSVNNKNIILFLIGQFITQFGNQIFAFSISYYILKITKSGLSFGISLALNSLPNLLLSPLSGFICDKFSKKKIIILTDLISGIVLLIFILISIVTGFKNIYIFCLMFILSSLNTINSIAVKSSLPIITSKNLLPKVNFYSQSIVSLSRIIAPFIAGIIISYVDISLFLIINSISFFISSFIECYLIFDENIKQKISTLYNLHNFYSSLKEGLNYIRTEKIIFLLISFSIITNCLFVTGYTIPVPYILNNVINFNSQQYGVAEGMSSFGAMLCSLLLAQKFKNDENFKLLIKSHLYLAAIIISLGIMSFTKNTLLPFIIIIIIKFLFGAMVVMCNVISTIIIQSKVSKEYIGRVFGFEATFSSALNPLTLVIVGYFIDKVQPFILPTLSGVLLFVLTLVLNYKLKS